ncbi:MAG: hypothetical protein O3C61_07065 [Proteobacteria bacterium]|nr:hypothetical protein [Pseudomonadota bacterium]
MKKSLIFLIFFFLFFRSVNSEENIPDKQFRGCVGKVSENFIHNSNQILIDSIEVDTDDYRKWTINGVKILIGRYRYVEEKYKKRFNAKILVNYKDGTKCVFDARIRQSGDEKDHIDLLGNSITQSLDVHLKNGNIRGITKFKLLRPKVRGVLEDEIFLTQILRNLDYLAPRTLKINARVNNVKTTMLFQEKAAKEMLEFNNRREGPIFEGDERFFFKKVEKIEDNQLSNWSVGIVDLMNESANHLLAKQVNSEIVAKSTGHKLMSLNSTSKINLIYLYFANRFRDTNNKFNHMDYDLDNNLLALFDSQKTLRLDEYNLLIEAVNGQHGLAINNRKFFWNSIENYFEPINYDSNANILLDIQPGQIRLPKSKQFFYSFSSLKNKLINLDVKTLKNEFTLSGLQISEKDIQDKIQKIIKNINQLEKNYNNLDKKLIEHNYFKTIEKISSNYYESIKKSNIDIALIKYNSDQKEFNKCENYLENCEYLDISNETLSRLLEGDLSEGNKSYQFLGDDLNFNKFSNNNFENSIVYEGTKILFNNGIEIKINEINDKIEINQKIPESKILFLNGTINNKNIIFSGTTNVSKNYSSTDINGLTGCLTFSNVIMDKVSIEANGSSCEDTINFINVSGNLLNISIQNSYRDALDVDFSNIKIKNINILNAGNDCADFSNGSYNLKSLNMKYCGDKSLSIGENSFVQLDYIIASDSITGIASKDSSLTLLGEAYLQNLETCLSAYNKKQEFDGSIIKVNKLICNNFKQKISSDKRSLIENSVLQKN